MFRRRILEVIAMAMLLPLVGCDTFGLGASAPPPAVAARPLDPKTDAVPDLIFAFNLPEGVQPLETGMIAHFDVTSAGKGSRHVKAALALADGEDVDDGLSPPPPGHTYYLFGFGDKDKAALGAAQQWLQALPPAAAPVATLTVDPRLCQIANVDPAVASFSVEIALPAGPPLTPLIAATTLADAPGGTHLKACAGG